MKIAVVAASVCLVLASAAMAAHGQFRGRLTSRPAPATVVRTPAFPTRAVLPVWWPWGMVLLPDATTLGSPPVPADAPPGGVQLDVQPWSALIYVDGELRGRVEAFRGYYRHLELPAGPHTIAIVSPGREPDVFDVVIIPGKTITYRTTLR